MWRFILPLVTIVIIIFPARQQASGTKNDPCIQPRLYVPGEQATCFACRVAALAGWKDLVTKGRDEKHCLYNPPPGWIIVDYELREKSENNGTVTVSLVGKDSRFMSLQQVNDLYNSLLDIAASYRSFNPDLANSFSATLKDKYKWHYQTILQVQSSHNTLYVTAEAESHGAGPIFADARRGWASADVYAVIRYVGSQEFDGLDAMSMIARSIGMKLGKKICIKNKCRYNITLAISYLGLNDQWYTKGWWNLKPGESSYLTCDKYPLVTNNRIIYLYGKCNDKNLEWSGEYKIKVEDREYPMRKIDATESDDGKYLDITLTCPNQ